jgi:hypothetical protein
MTLRDRTHPEFRHMIGQRVEFMSQGNKCYGKLEFAGINTLLHGQFQVTADRVPYWPINPKSLKLSPL